MQIAILAYKNMTALDAVGPYQVLTLLPGAEMKWVAAEAGPVLTDTGLNIVADSTFDEVTHPDILVVPGGLDVTHAEDKATLDWICAVNKTSTWTTSVCTGALILGKAGLLEGLPATTHWAALEKLAQYGATPVAARVVRAGKIVTGAGVTAGIDTALQLAEYVAGAEVAQTIQLCMQYDPQPPFDAGEPGIVSPQVLADAHLFLEKSIAKADAQNTA